MKKPKTLLVNLGFYLLDAATIFVSYVLAVVLRYYIMESSPGINALSPEYLFIAIVYSLIMANIFQIIQGPVKYLYRSDYSGYIRILSVHAIGCLVLLAFFYVANVIYFSRWALILFWLISSVLGILKNELLRSFVWWNRSKGRNKIHVLVVGEGPAAKEYIKTIFKNPFYGFEIYGYLTLGRDDTRGDSETSSSPPDELGAEAAEDDAFGIRLKIWNPDRMAEDEIFVPCRGDAEDLGAVLENNDINEVVFAPSEGESVHMEALIAKARSCGADVSLVTGFNKFIPNNPTVQEIGGLKRLDLGNEYENIRNTYRLGLTISFAILILFVLMKNFNVGLPDGVTSFARFDRYKSVLFSVSGIFLFLLLASSLRKKTVAGHLMCAIVSWIILTLAVVIYENIYFAGADPTADIITDLVMTTIFIAGCYCVHQIAHSVLSDSTPLLF